MTSTNKTTKTFRNKKKIDEVKEIIQNKPDIEISRVLEYFDNDVGKAIDAFVTGESTLSYLHTFEPV